MSETAIVTLNDLVYEYIGELEYMLEVSDQLDDYTFNRRYMEPDRDEYEEERDRYNNISEKNELCDDLNRIREDIDKAIINGADPYYDDTISMLEEYDFHLENLLHTLRQPSPEELLQHILTLYTSVSNKSKFLYEKYSELPRDISSNIGRY